MSKLVSAMHRINLVLDATVPPTPNVPVPDPQWVLESPPLLFAGEPRYCPANGYRGEAIQPTGTPVGTMYYLGYGLVFISTGERDAWWRDLRDHVELHFIGGLGHGFLESQREAEVEKMLKRPAEEILKHPATLVLPAPQIVRVRYLVDQPFAKSDWWRRLTEPHGFEFRSFLIITTEDAYGGRESYCLRPHVNKTAVLQGLGELAWATRLRYEIGCFQVAGLSVFLPSDLQATMIPEYLRAYWSNDSSRTQAVVDKIEQVLPKGITWEREMYWQALYHTQRLRAVPILETLFGERWKILDEFSSRQPLCFVCRNLSPVGAKVCSTCSKPLC